LTFAEVGSAARPHVWLSQQYMLLPIAMVAPSNYDNATSTMRLLRGTVVVPLAKSAMSGQLEPAARVRASALAMSLAALIALMALALPWLRFETTFDLGAEPGALDMFQRYYAPAGPLDAFTRLYPNDFGIAMRFAAAAGITAEILILIAALVAWRRGRPLWPVRIALVLAGLLIADTVLSYLLVGMVAQTSAFYARTIPTWGWWLSLVAFGATLYFGANVLSFARRTTVDSNTTSI
jgi:hypothetical protein